MRTGLNKAAVSQLRAVFCEFPSLERVILFGSRAKGTHAKGSDIDLAVKGLSDLEVIRLSMILNEELDLPYFFDVIGVESITNQELKKHIQRKGKVFHEIAFN